MLPSGTKRGFFACAFGMQVFPMAAKTPSMLLLVWRRVVSGIGALEQYRSGLSTRRGRFAPVDIL